jgi:hypothetical protein
MNKVISCLVKTHIEDEWLADKVLNISLSNQINFLENRYPIKILNDFNEISIYRDHAEFLFVNAVGSVIIDYDVIWDQLHSIPPDIGLIGHIIWYPDQKTPHLDQQSFIIRTEALKNTEINFDDLSIFGKKFVRSIEDMHDDHAPLWIDLLQEEELLAPGFGTHIMKKIIENGYKVRNFDSNWRTSHNINLIIPKTQDNTMPAKAYFYPGINSSLFSKCLRNLEIDENLYDAQKECITILKECLKFNILNAYHYDDTYTDFKSFSNGKNANLVISTANGFQGEALAMYNGAKKIIFYDINPNNINFKKYLYEHFDGNNYDQFFTIYAKTHNLRIEPNSTLEKFTANSRMKYTKEILKNWNYIKTLEKEYIIGDLFEIIDIILSKITKETIFYTSTILTEYLITHFIRSNQDINHINEKIKMRIDETNSFWYNV